MDHFKSLRLKNWLCYEDATFNFHSGVNMIIGPTDHGKSAMMDALYKLINNRPMGDDFQSWWGGETLIALRLDNSIIRYRKETQARYQIKNVKTKKVITFTAFRSKVPQEITDLLQLDRKINIQKQLEKKAPIFLLSENPADVARHLNEVANLGNIDVSLALGKEAVSQDTKKKKIVDAAIEVKEKELIKYSKLDSLNILVSHAEKIQSRIDKDTKMLDWLEEGLEALTVSNTVLKQAKKRLKLKPLILDAMILQEQIEHDNRKIKIWRDSFDDLQTYQKRLGRIQKRLKAKPMIRKCFNLSLVINQYYDDIAKLETDLLNMQSTFVKIKEIKIKLKKKKIRYKKEFPAICPLCSSKVDKEKL